MPHRNFNCSVFLYSSLVFLGAFLIIAMMSCGGLQPTSSEIAAGHFIYAIGRPDAVVAHRINPDGTPSLLPASPFPAPSGPTSIAAGGPFVFVGGWGPFQASVIANGQMITTYRQDPSTGTITAVASLPRDNLHLPLYMVPDARGRSLFVVNEAGGLEVHSVAPDGQMTQVYESDAQFHAFSAPAVHPNGAFLYVWAQENLSQPAIFRFRLNAGSGAPVEMQEIQTTALVGIRITPDGRFLLALSPEPEGYNLCSFSLNSTTGLPPTNSANQASSTSCVFAGTLPTGITVHPSGKLLAITNWTAADGSAGTVTMYNFDQGNLALVNGTTHDAGAQALAPKFSPDGKWLLVFDRLSSSKMHVFAVDPNTGNIAPIAGSPFDMGNTGVPVIH
jgi:6-phosphogluconolactonase (cycloisomerase 2 family)